MKSKKINRIIHAKKSLQIILQICQTSLHAWENVNTWITDHHQVPDNLEIASMNLVFKNEKKSWHKSRTISERNFKGKHQNKFRDLLICTCHYMYVSTKYGQGSMDFSKEVLVKKVLPEWVLTSMGFSMEVRNGSMLWRYGF